MKLLIFLLTFSLFSTSCSSTDEGLREIDSKPTLPQTIEKDVSYGSSSQQTYDVYLPAGRDVATTKTIVLIHGGSWVSGNKNDLNPLIARLQNSLPDYAIVNMNYRLANGGSIKAFPNQLEDIATVLTNLKTTRSDLQINGEVALLGVSAGAHLSALYASTMNTGDQVKAVVNIVGPTDFTDPYYKDNPGFQLLLANLVETSAYAVGTDIAKALSPAQQITESTPPIINFYGNQDQLVALSQLERLEAGLMANAVPHESTIYDGGHGNWNETQYTDLEKKTKLFLERYF